MDPVEATRPAIALRVELLPAPLAPSSTTMEPSGTERLTPLTAATSPYFTFRSETSSIGHPSRADRHQGFGTSAGSGMAVRIGLRLPSSISTMVMSRIGMRLVPA